MNVTRVFRIHNVWVFIVVSTAALLLSSQANAQSSGPYVDQCTSGTVDYGNSISQTVCMYGDASVLDAYVYTEDDEFAGSGSFYIPDVGSDGEIDGVTSSLGANYGGTTATASESITATPYEWYTLNGIYYECYDPSGEGDYPCTWGGGNWGLSVSVQVTPSATLSVASSSPNSTAGQSVTFTATVSSGPSGTVTFYDSGTSIGTGTISATTATLTTNSLTLGDHIITAYWPGDSTYPAVTSSPITQVVYQNGPIQLPSGTNINTLAGNGTASFSGDGGPALISELFNPMGVALDSSGNIYVSDPDNRRVRMINPATGNISTVAGNGSGGYTGDNGPATSATLLYPEGLAIDNSGNLYIADVGDSVVRKVDLSTHIITTVAGNGVMGYSGDAGLATSAELNQPFGVAVDTYGNIYITDWSNCRIRKVTRATSRIDTIAGNGTCGYSGDGWEAWAAEINYPTGVAVDPSGNLYIVDSHNNRIRKVAAAGTITTVAGNGTAGFFGDSGAASSAEMYYPYGIAVDGGGNLFISDTYNQRVREILNSTQTITTIAGTGTAGYTGDGGPAISAELDNPEGVAVDPSGNVYITDLQNQRLRVIGTARANSAQSVVTSSTPAMSGSLVTFTSITSTGGGTAPTGTTTFLDGSTVIGAGSITPVSATNLVQNSQAFGASTWGGYCGPTTNMTVNTAAVTAPDGTNTATQFNVPTSIPCDGSQPGLGVLTTIPSGLTVGQTYTVSVWLRGAVGGENIGFGLNDCAFGGVTLTNNWKRYTATYTSIPSSIASCSDGSRGFQVAGGGAPGATYYVWGAQVEKASTAGPYIATGSSSLTGYGGLATYSTNLLSAGTHPITSTWPGDANYRPATSNQLSQAIVAPTIPTITWGTPSAISYGTALSGTQLNASTSVAGTLFYTPELGAVLTPGTHELLVTFYPTDSGDYTTATATVNLTVNTSSTPVSTIYSYCITGSLGSDCPSSPSGYTANGNIQAYTDSVNGTWSSIGYDSLNRLTSAQATAGYFNGTNNGGLTVAWSYDSFGNRTSQSYSGSSNVSLPPASSALYDEHNRVTMSTLMGGGPLGYDPSGDGDVTQDNANAYAYDGEGRICAVEHLSSGAVTQYIYDAEGNRVAKGTANLVSGTLSCDTTANGFSVTNSYALGSGNEQLTEMALTSGSLQWVHTNVFGAGELLATYDQDPTSETQAFHFQLADWLGTRRVQTDYAGNAEETCTSLPYGDDLSCPATSLPTADDATEHHFTGREHDSESGNEFLLARYYSVSAARFISPDWSSTLEPVPYASLEDPATLNLYSYVFNTPLRLTDSTGHFGGVNREFDWLSIESEPPAFNSPVAAAAYAMTNGGFGPDAVQNWLNTAFSNLWANYPTHVYSSTPSAAGSIWNLIGGDVARFGKYLEDNGEEANTCALRMSYALNHSGLDIGKQHGTFAGADGKQYFLSVANVQTFLTKTIGKPERLKGGTFDGPRGATGIISFNVSAWRPGATGHFSLWNGRGLIDRSEEGYDRWIRTGALPESTYFWGVK